MPPGPSAQQGVHSDRRGHKTAQSRSDFVTRRSEGPSFGTRVKTSSLLGLEASQILARVTDSACDNTYIDSTGLFPTKGLREDLPFPKRLPFVIQHHLPQIPTSREIQSRMNPSVNPVQMGFPVALPFPLPSPDGGLSNGNPNTNKDDHAGPSRPSRDSFSTGNNQQTHINSDPHHPLSDQDQFVNPNNNNLQHPNRIDPFDFTPDSQPASWQPTQTQRSPEAEVRESQEASSTFVNPKSKYCESGFDPRFRMGHEGRWVVDIRKADFGLILGFGSGQGLSLPHFRYRSPS